MEDVLKSFTLGAYRDLQIEAEDETAYINGLVNAVVDNSVYEFDEEAVDREAERIATDLEKGLEEAKKPVKAFCYLNQIPEGGLVAYCRGEFVRGIKEDSVINGIAAAEGIEVEAYDLALCRQNYAEEYSRALLDGMGPDEMIAKKALLAKKVLHFLMEANKWVTNEQ